MQIKFMNDLICKVFDMNDFNHLLGISGNQTWANHDAFSAVAWLAIMITFLENIS